MLAELLVERGLQPFHLGPGGAQAVAFEADAHVVEPPDLWERFEPVKKWHESGQPPASIVTRKQPFDLVTNERLLCPWPQQARYTGPEGQQNDPANWVADNFRCE